MSYSLAMYDTFKTHIIMCCSILLGFRCFGLAEQRTTHEPLEAPTGFRYSVLCTKNWVTPRKGPKRFPLSHGNSFLLFSVFFLSDLTLALKRFCLQSCHPSLDLSVLKSDCVKNEFLDFLFITFINKCRLSYVCPYTPCEIACINICAHVKDPVVHVRVRWIK